MEARRYKEYYVVVGKHLFEVSDVLASLFMHSSIYQMNLASAGAGRHYDIRGLISVSPASKTPVPGGNVGKINVDNGEEAMVVWVKTLEE